MVGMEGETKRGFFTRWQLNSLAFVEFVQLHWMAIEMDSVATVGW